MDPCSRILSFPRRQNLTRSQKIKSTAYGSFSLFGLYCILVSGLLIVLVSYLLEPLSSVILKRYGHHRHQHLEWTANSTLQLQRLAHEGLGLGTWSKCTDDIPITKPDELLGCLDTTDCKHPVISTPLKPENGLSKIHSATGTLETATLNNVTSGEQTLSSSPSADGPLEPGFSSQVVTDAPEHEKNTSVVAKPETRTAGDTLNGDNDSAENKKVRRDETAAEIADKTPALMASEPRELEQAGDNFRGQGRKSELCGGPQR